MEPAGHVQTKEVQRVLNDNKQYKDSKNETNTGETCEIEVACTHRGTVREDATHYVAALPAMAAMGLPRFQKKIPKAAFDSKETAYEAAQKYLGQESINAATQPIKLETLLLSRIQLSPKGTYREIAIRYKDEDLLYGGDEHLDMLLLASIYIQDPKKDKTYYAVISTNNHSKMAHDRIYPEFTQVEHIDGNGLNNLR